MFLLDTNALLAHLLYPSRLGSQTIKKLSRADGVFLSAVSIAEISIKQLLKKIAFSPSILQLARDPDKQMIVASASSSHLNLVTSDGVMLDLGLPWIEDSFQ